MPTPEWESARSKLITRRALIVGMGQLGLFGLLATRLHHLQIDEADQYLMLSEDNRINVDLLAPSRGIIYDRFGVPLAENTPNFRLILVREQVPDMDATLKRIGEVISLSDYELKRIHREIKRRRAFVPVTIKENLSWEQMSRIEIAAPALPGVSIDVGEARTSPLGDATGHVLGYVAAVDEADMGDDPVLALPGFRIGKTGVERDFDEDLRGSAGRREVEVNAVGRVIRELSRSEGDKGRNLTMTVDAELQKDVKALLSKHRSASAVVMDVLTGAIYAMVSHPGFDPNLFITGIPIDVWQGFISDPAAPLTNKAIAGQYPPGSTFKMITALAALENGVITPAHTVNCIGHVDLGSHRFHCWKRGGHGKLDLTQAIAQSCDSWFYEVGRKVGIEAISDIAHRFGLGETTGLDVSGELPGLVPDKAWKQSHIGEPWHQGETLNTAIGQGYLKTTPLQLAVMTARLVNGGRAVQPYALQSVDGVATDMARNSAEGWPSLGINSGHLWTIVKAMEEVTQGERGTARGSRTGDPDFRMGGKTGTAQVKKNHPGGTRRRHRKRRPGLAVSSPCPVRRLCPDRGASLCLFGGCGTWGRWQLYRGPDRARYHAGAQETQSRTNSDFRR